MFHSTGIWITFFQFCLDLKPSPNQRLNVHFAGSKHIPCWPSLGLLRSCKCWLSQRWKKLSTATLPWHSQNSLGFHKFQPRSPSGIMRQGPHGQRRTLNTNSLTALQTDHAWDLPLRWGRAGHALKPPVARNSHGQLAHNLPCSQCSICVLSIRHWPYACHSRSPQP